MTCGVTPEGDEFRDPEVVPFSPVSLVVAEASLDGVGLSVLPVVPVVVAGLASAPAVCLLTTSGLINTICGIPRGIVWNLKLLEVVPAVFESFVCLELDPVVPAVPADAFISVGSLDGVLTEGTSPLLGLSLLAILSVL